MRDLTDEEKSELHQHCIFCKESDFILASFPLSLVFEIYCVECRAGYKVTHHTAGITHDSRENMRTWNAQQVIGLLRGERPPRLVNADAWPAFTRRFEAALGARAGEARRGSARS